MVTHRAKTAVEVKYKSVSGILEKNYINLRHVGVPVEYWLTWLTGISYISEFDHRSLNYIHFRPNTFRNDVDTQITLQLLDKQYHYLILQR